MVAADVGGDWKRESRGEPVRNLSSVVEGRIPFELVYEQLLDQRALDRYKLLILPDIAALSDAQCEQIRQFVGHGGSLLATFETSLYDEAGKQRGDFGLTDLLGVSYAGKTVGPIKNSYINFERDTKHEILSGFDDAGRMINTINYADVTPALYFGKLPLTRVPSYPDLPMEDVFPRQERTEIAEVYLRKWVQAASHTFPVISSARFGKCSIPITVAYWRTQFAGRSTNQRWRWLAARALSMFPRGNKMIADHCT